MGDPHYCNCPDCPETKRTRGEYGLLPPNYVPVCTCGDPLLMIIPPEGTWIFCSAHGYKFLRGSDISL